MRGALKRGYTQGWERKDVPIRKGSLTLAGDAQAVGMEVGDASASFCLGPEISSGGGGALHSLDIRHIYLGCFF